MELLNENDNFLFNEDTRFLELMIESELEETESYEVLKSYLLKSLVDAYEYAQFEGFEDYELLDKKVLYRKKVMTLKLGFEYEDDENLHEIEDLTFSEFTERLLFQLSLVETKVEEVEDHFIKSFPLTIEGLLQAVKDFYAEAKLNKLT